MQLVIAILGSGVLSAIISGVFALINNSQKKKSGLSTGMQILLKASIKEDCARYLKQGHISLSEQEELTEAFACYKELGGNGFIDQLMSDVAKLPKTN